MSDIKRILFVCLGNICRSPAAEAIMKAKVHQLGLDHLFIIDSAGTYGGHAGELPDYRMRQHAGGRGYEMTSRSRKFYADSDFEEFDMIIAMDASNFSDLKSMAKNEEEEKKIYKMTDFCRLHSNYSSVPDPYYGGDAGFELVLDLLEDAIDGLLKA
ncbi:low molecular weight phosphotyrosine protein phosphatase [Odoribacter sp. OttesenSCG-928-A06]|nr:low molecular weight phosphotyrosine protein phosphatase [Odoribacter sp. OttesenSCG-928-A06]